MSLDDRLAEIAGSARGLWDAPLPTVPDTDPQTLSELAARWQRALASTDPLHLQRRLDFDGLDAGQIAAALRPQMDPAAPWLARLRALVTGETAPVSPSGRFADLSAGWVALPIDAACDPDAPVPFEEAWLPALSVARAELVTRLAGGAGDAPAGLRIAPAACAALERALLQRLGELGQTALFELFRTRRKSGSELRLALLGGTPASGRAAYDRFLSDLAADRMLGVFTRFPVLARLVVTAIDQWADATAEMIRRLDADFPALGARFGLSSPELTAVGTSLSDPHNHGRTVCRLTFADDARLIYKPKPLANEATFHAFVAWTRDHLPEMPLRALTVLDCGSYGYEEFAAARAPEPHEEPRYYERVGVLLAVLHLLKANDCHRENLIACGDTPVFVDGETVLHPEPAGADAGDWTERSGFLGSVVRTGLLPRWLVRTDGALALDVTALGGAGADQARLARPQWVALNSDDMHRRLVDTSLTPVAGGPDAAVPKARAADIARGFAAAYRLFLDRRNALLASGGPIEAFRGLPVRFLQRPTIVYVALLERALAPEFLTHGVWRSLALDGAARAFLDEPARPAGWPLLAAELRALERLDVPAFTAANDRTDLPVDGSGAQVAGFFAASGLDDVRAGVAELSEEDLALQVRVISGSMEARTIRADTGGDPTSDVPDDATPLSADDLLAEAIAIAARIRGLGLRDRDGHLNWLGLREIGGTGRQQLAPLDDALYAGNGGIALFFAALFHLTGDTDHRTAALAALARLRATLADARTAGDLVAGGLIGGALGFGSLIYALVRVGTLIGDATLVREAERASALITPERVAEDRAFDVMGGAAGAILALLALDSDAATDRALTCGEGLLSASQRTDDGCRVWLGRLGRAQTGFSHGAAGIAYALQRLEAATGAGRFGQAASEAMAFERSRFVPAADNWPDLRAGDPAEPRFAAGWCNGAPGIGLARLASPAGQRDAFACTEIDAAVRITCACDARGADHLCCGTLGRLETLSLAATAPERAPLAATVAATTAKVVRRARRTGDYRFAGNASGDMNPGLFTGLAGIGYQLARQAQPGRLPSVLLWQ